MITFLEFLNEATTSKKSFFGKIDNIVCSYSIHGMKPEWEDVIELGSSFELKIKADIEKCANNFWKKHPESRVLKVADAPKSKIAFENWLKETLGSLPSEWIYLSRWRHQEEGICWRALLYSGKPHAVKSDETLFYVM